MDFSLRQLCQSQKHYPLLSHVAGICYSAPVTNAWPERSVSAVKRIKKRYFYFGSIFFCMMQWTYFRLFICDTSVLHILGSIACSKMTAKCPPARFH